MTRRSRLASRPHLERLDQRLVLSAVTPGQIQAAYGLGTVTYKGTTLTGAGQTIAIIDAYNDPNAAAELAAFDARYGLPAANLTVDNLSGNKNNTNAGWEEEEALDIEAAHLAAPGAKILLVEATSDDTAALMAAVKAADQTAGVTVVSMSWGGSDTRNETQYDGDFTTPGITYLAASGDNGSRGGAEWPADSPNVIAVGGTSLTISTGGTITQAAWSSSGGGYSSVETEPSYQAKAQSTGLRSTPDVSAVADPNTGLMTYTVAGGGWQQVGGTSLSTPIWAGLIAQADQGRALAGESSLGYTSITTGTGTVNANLALYGLYYAPSGSFNDVTTGNGASTGYDTSTGLGTPNAKALIPALIADTASNVTTAGGSTVNGVGGDPIPTSGGGTTGGGQPTPPPWWPWGRHGFFGATGSFSGSPTGWAGTFIPRNSGQSAPEPFRPITPIRGYRFSTVTAPKVATPKTPAQPEAVTPPASESSTTARQRAVDAALHGLGRQWA